MQWHGENTGGEINGFLFKLELLHDSNSDVDFVKHSISNVDQPQQYHVIK